MSAIQDAIISRLSGDSTLMILTLGGIWNRPLLLAGDGSTPNAWWTPPGKTVPRLRASAVVPDGGEVPAPGGEIVAGFDSFPQVHLYFEATSQGKANLEAADERIVWLLSSNPDHGSGWSISWLGPPVVFTALERSPVRDSDEFPGYVHCFRRFRGEHIRRKAA
jgi:hypothetical protein